MMNTCLRDDAERIIAAALQAVQPDAAVKRALSQTALTGRVVLVAAGKAAWQMAKAAYDALGQRISQGVVCTKYGHVRGKLPRCLCLEGGHPVPDENSFRATAQAIALVSNLAAEDTVLLLLSGGGSALFEKPLIPGAELQDITEQLLACGADIMEINTLRKRLSAVKGGRFAQLCAPARVVSVVLSDIIGDPLDMIASGPAYPDSSTCKQAMDIVERYGLRISPQAKLCLAQETPKQLFNVTTYVTGSVRELCAAAAEACSDLGYQPILLTDQLCCQAREAGSFLGAILCSHSAVQKRLAFIAGGETVVKLTGHGQGGRNQELALSAAPAIAGLKNVALFSVGSDGTDGPTDAAGGYVDGDTKEQLEARGFDIGAVLVNNDAYHALQCINGLIFTGPTGTNVNDVAVGLVQA